MPSSHHEDIAHSQGVLDSELDLNNTSYQELATVDEGADSGDVSPSHTLDQKMKRRARKDKKASGGADASSIGADYYN